MKSLGARMNCKMLSFYENLRTMCCQIWRQNKILLAAAVAVLTKTGNTLHDYVIKNQPGPPAKTTRKDKQVNNFMVVSAREQICGYAQDLTMAKTMAYELSKENPGVKYTVFVAKDSFMEIPKTYQLGQRFLSQNGNGSEYLLANTEPNKVNLINLKTGRRLSTSVVVDNTDEISEKEFRKLVGSFYDEFQEI